MLSFEEFQDYCKEHILERLPEWYADARVSVNEMTKNNGKVLTGLTILPEGENISPNVYLDGFYKDYQHGIDLDDVMDEIADVYLNGMKPAEEMGDIAQKFKDVEFVKDRIIMVAVNREKNAKLLETVPHTNHEDLALIYKVLISREDAGTATITITNDHLPYWNMTTAEVHELAMQNTRELLPVSVMSMNDVMRDILGKDGMDEEMIAVLCDDRPADQQMFVITNTSKVNGAASMFYEDVLSDLAEKMGSNIYILPSSIHESIAVSARMGGAEELAQMVAEINAGQVAPDEQLSDHVYLFDAEAKTLTLADTTTQALGLSAAENKEFYDTAQTNTEGSRPRHHR